MYKDVEGKWKTSASVLPLWIHSAEDVLNDAITEQIQEEQLSKKK
jgi:hypothetical protein